ncbi:MAG: glycosyltransferase family 39 protein [Odoribacter sp.]
MVICTLTILPFLGLTDYNTKGEPREAIVAYSMLESGNWILPRNYGGEIAFKPPFFHWSIAAASSLTGEVSEYSSRLPSALALIVMTLAIYWFYAKRKDAWVGLLTACVTLTCFEIHRAGFACRVDMVLTAFIVLALLQFYNWYERKQKGIPWWAILFMGIATLTKGPVGIILPCLVTGVFLWIKEGRFWKIFFTLSGIALLACILPAIWYGLAYQQGKDEFLQLMMEENLGRFMGKMSYGSHENPAYYNVIMLIAGYVPWTLLLLFSLFGLHYRKPSGTLKEGWKNMITSIRNWEPLHLFSFLSIALIFIFYCIPASKRGVYLLPVYPFIGYFLTIYFLKLIRQGSKSIKAFGIFLSFAVVLLTATFVVIKCGLIPETIFTGKRALENTDFLNALKNVPLNPINLLCIIAPLVALIYFWREKRKNPFSEKILFALCIIIFSTYIALDGVYQPAVLGSKSDKNLALQVQKIAPEGKIYSYGSYFYGVNFYNANRMAIFGKELPEQGTLLVGQKDYEDLQQKYGAEYIFDEIYQSSRRSCDIRDIVCIYRFNKKKTLLP